MITATARLIYRISATARMVSRQTGTCAAATVENSDASFSETIPSGGTEILDDTNFIFKLNGVIENTITLPSMINQEFNINFN